MKAKQPNICTAHPGVIVTIYDNRRTCPLCEPPKPSNGKFEAVLQKVYDLVQPHILPAAPTVSDLPVPRQSRKKQEKPPGAADPLTFTDIDCPECKKIVKASVTDVGTFCTLCGEKIKKN